MSKEQIDLKISCTQTAIDEIADKIYDYNKELSTKLKVQVLNLGFVREDIDRLYEDVLEEYNNIFQNGKYD